jgi:hypothetical protein
MLTHSSPAGSLADKELRAEENLRGSLANRRSQEGPASIGGRPVAYARQIVQDACPLRIFRGNAIS